MSSKFRQALTIFADVGIHPNQRIGCSFPKWWWWNDDDDNCGRTRSSRKTWKMRNCLNHLVNTAIIDQTLVYHLAHVV